MLRDGVSGRWQRINESAYQLIRRLNGTRDLASAYLECQDSYQMSQKDALVILNALDSAEFIDWGIQKDPHLLHQKAEAEQKRKRLSRFMSPFSIKISLFDPDAFLSKKLSYGDAIFSKAGLVCVLLSVIAGILFALEDWNNIVNYWSVRGFTGQSFWLLPVVYVVMKTVHEFMHALAAKHWGAEVHDMGLVMMLLIPIPYVDASEAWSFSEKHRRILVSAAGIIAELVLASVAAIIFVCVEVGIVKDIAYTTMLLGSLSTLLFNGNPLMRFDGYYVLADAVEIPNLASRSSRYWEYLVQRYLFGLRDATSPVTAKGERVWFVFYGATSKLYRLVITLTIALFVAEKIPVLGVALAVWAIVMQIVVPLVNQFQKIFHALNIKGEQRRGITVFAIGVVCIVVTVFLVPVPLSSTAQGVVWLPERAHIRAGTDGILQRISVKEDQFVSAGDVVMSIQNEQLNAYIDTLKWELTEVKSQLAIAQVDDRVQIRSLRMTIDNLQKNLNSLYEEQNSLLVVSPVSGNLVIPNANQLTGSYVHKGDILGYVLEQKPSIIKAAIPQAEIGLIRHGVNAVNIRLADNRRTSISAEINRETPSATRHLPSPALGTLGGGDIPVDTTDQKGLTAADNIYIVDIALSEQELLPRVGGRAHVRFEYPAEPLGYRFYRALRQLLLARLAV
tara:strand:- start:3462 stop:5489 length:2028 start_codon:yes stop_codon:yes gene_type:complete